MRHIPRRGAGATVKTIEGIIRWINAASGPETRTILMAIDESRLTKGRLRKLYGMISCEIDIS